MGSNSHEIINLIITILMIGYCAINIAVTLSDKREVYFRKTTVILSIISIIWGMKTLLAIVILNNASGMYLLIALWLLGVFSRYKSVEIQYLNAKKRLNKYIKD